MNARTGTGSDYAISNPVAPASANWAATASDYNDLYSSKANTTTEWGIAINKNISQWQIAAGGDAHSVNNSVSFVASAYDLLPDSASNCALNNAGIPITTPFVINTDINSIPRDAVNPDIGAYEFTYSVFTVTANSNSPVCSGSTVDLSVNPGEALSPSYIWKNPSAVVVSIVQNPTVAAVSGAYSVTVTDVNGCIVSASTTVSLNQRPSATISGPSSICEGSPVTLILTVTGSGTLTGSLSDGTVFNGTAPTIPVSVTPSVTTAFYIDSLDDAFCSSTRPDIPDTVTIISTHSGDWLGNVSTNWNDALNWCGGIPVSTTNVNIQAGVLYYPVISAGTAAVNDLTIGTGASLTVTAASLQVASDISNSGTFTASNGTIEMNGVSAQTMPASVFTGDTIKNLTLNNATGVTLNGVLKLTGVLLAAKGTFNAGGNLTLISTAAQTAAVDGSGSGEVLGNLIVQRYIASGFGYKYFSSPFQNDTVGDFSDDMNLSTSFPTFYRHDENLGSNGWVAYTNTTGVLSPMQGYAANLGSIPAARTVDLKGVVNNHIISRTLYNHNMAYTQGFNLVGNPYPSPINWDAAGGWTKANIDNAVYYFNNGTTDQYSGVYSSYINGVSSDGVAGPTIAAMQGFFVHVSNGTFPVSGTLAVNNSARILNSAAAFYRVYGQNSLPLLRLTAGFSDLTNFSDPVTFYFDDNAISNFNKKLDALKLMNSDSIIPNLFAVTADTEKLSIKSMATPQDTVKAIPLGLKTIKDGWISFNARDIKNMPAGIYIYLSDQKTRINTNLQKDTPYRLFLPSGDYKNRFFLIFSTKELTGVTNNTNATGTFHAYSAGGRLYVNANLAAGEKANLTVVNMLGQVICRQEVTGNIYQPLNAHFTSGVYVVNLSGSVQKQSKKIFIGDR
ncbi:MAG: T9SS type A sorting domain-containing protein [Bacteroidota bacterium]